jgi:hypothetical protein
MRLTWALWSRSSRYCPKGELLCRGELFLRAYGEWSMLETETINILIL